MQTKFSFSLLALIFCVHCYRAPWTQITFPFQFTLIIFFTEKTSHFGLRLFPDYEKGSAFGPLVVPHILFKIPNLNPHPFFLSVLCLNSILFPFPRGRACHNFSTTVKPSSWDATHRVIRSPCKYTRWVDDDIEMHKYFNRVLLVSSPMTNLEEDDLPEIVLSIYWERFILCEWHTKVMLWKANKNIVYTYPSQNLSLCRKAPVCCDSWKVVY